MTDEIWMDRARLAAEASPDRSRKTGALIVSAAGEEIASGCNTFPHRIAHDVEARHERPAKYLWTEHAERNAIYAAAAAGVATAGSRMYMPWYPCADCARAVIQAGIVEIVCIEPDWQDVRWAADFAVVREMLAEAGITVRWAPGAPPTIRTETRG
jgi:dCMP deaminase